MTALDPAKHDPIERQLDDEPRFPLMGRDCRAEVLVAVYAYLRERKWEHAMATLEAGIERLKAEPPRPDKDKEHAASARVIAEKIYLWRVQCDLLDASPAPVDSAGAGGFWGLWRDEAGR